MKIHLSRNIIVLFLDLLVSFNLFAQTSISGIVKAEDDTPLVGVIVHDKSSGNATATDIDGRWSLTASDKTTLEFLLLGYKTEIVVLNGRTYLEVIMVENAELLEDVVVIGYGTVKKTDLTGAVASVKGDKLTQTSSRNVLSGLQGKMAGVNITMSSGAPGADAMVRIRGIGTINNSNPIYVVDGFQVSDINYLNMNDIENIEVLKDASATAIYGSRGANGVVLVTTKKGVHNNFHLSAGYGVGFQSANKKIDMLNAWEFATLFREAHENSNVTLNSSDDAITQYVIDNKFEGTDWQSKVFRKMRPVHNADVSLSYGGDKNQYLLSMQYTNIDGLVKYNDYEKLNLRFYNKHRLSKVFNFETDISYSLSDKHDINSSVLTSSLYMDPICAPWDENKNNYGSKTFNQIEAMNPVLIIENNKYDNLSNVNRLVGNFALTANDFFTKGLFASTRFGYDSNNNNWKGFYPEYFLDTNTYNSESILTENITNNISWLWSSFINYKKEWKDKHALDVMAGFEMQRFTHKWNYMQVFDVPYDPDQQYVNMAGNQERKNINGDYYASSLMSVFYRVNYKFLSKYLITATVRTDGSSKFIGKNKWGIFPSVALAWDLKQEKWLRNVDFLSNLKIRASWGVVGNQNSLDNPYVYASTITSESNNYILNGAIVNGYYAADLANKDIKWESTENYNFGIDFSLLQNSLSGSFNIFQNTTRDMIATPMAPVYVGYHAVSSNIGSMRNRGLEFSLGYKKDFGNNLFIDVNWNITSVKNKVLSLGTSTAIRAGNLSRLDPTTYTDVGTEIGAFYGLGVYGTFTQEDLDNLHAKYPGYQPAAQPGDLWFVDVNGDNRIDKNDDKMYLGSAMPDFISGLNCTFKYKGFDMNLYFLGSYGNEIVNGQYVYINGSNIKSNWSRRMWNRSTKNNVTNVPRLDIADINGNTSTFSQAFVEDGSYLRLKNIQLGYSLPKRISDKLHMSALRFYVSVDNLFTITKYSGWDPEPVSFGTLDGGVDYGTYPLARTFTFGINFNF